MSSDKERLIIAADGALGYIPFGVLPLARAGESTPLLQTLEVSNVPSMSAVAAQRQRTAQAPPKDSRRVRGPGIRCDGSTPCFGWLRRRHCRRDPCCACGAPRTPTCTGAEAAAIAELVAPDSRLVVTGFGANREQVLNAPLSDYRIVHFATHGLVDSRYPGLSALAFSQFDAAGQPLNGLLRLQDVYRLDLNADFVVLSGCETAWAGRFAAKAHRPCRRVSVCRGAQSRREPLAGSGPRDSRADDALLRLRVARCAAPGRGLAAWRNARSRPSNGGATRISGALSSCLAIRESARNNKTKESPNGKEEH